MEAQPGRSECNRRGGEVTTSTQHDQDGATQEKTESLLNDREPESPRYLKVLLPTAYVAGNVFVVCVRVRVCSGYACNFRSLRHRNIIFGMVVHLDHI